MGTGSAKKNNPWTWPTEEAATQKAIKNPTPAGRHSVHWIARERWEYHNVENARTSAKGKTANKRSTANSIREAADKVVNQ